jgi:hypothetical protein
MPSRKKHEYSCHGLPTWPIATTAAAKLAEPNNQHRPWPIDADLAPDGPLQRGTRQEEDRDGRRHLGHRRASGRRYGLEVDA